MEFFLKPKDWIYPIQGQKYLQAKYSLIPMNVIAKKEKNLSSTCEHGPMRKILALFFQ